MPIASEKIPVTAPLRVDGSGKGLLSTGDIKRGESTIRVSEKAVGVYAIRVVPGPHDHTRWINA